MNNEQPAPISAEEIPLIMTVPQLATLLKVGRNAAYDLVNSGEIQTIRIGKSIRISRNAVLHYLAA